MFTQHGCPSLHNLHVSNDHKSMWTEDDQSFHMVSGKSSIRLINDFSLTCFTFCFIEKYECLQKVNRFVDYKVLIGSCGGTTDRKC